MTIPNAGKFVDVVSKLWPIVIAVVIGAIAFDRAFSEVQREQQEIIGIIKGTATAPGVLSRVETIERYVIAHEQMVTFRVGDIEKLQKRDEQIRHELANFTSRIEQISADVRMIRSQLEKPH